MKKPRMSPEDLTRQSAALKEAYINNLVTNIYNKMIEKSAMSQPLKFSGIELGMGFFPNEIRERLKEDGWGLKKIRNTETENGKFKGVSRTPDGQNHEYEYTLYEICPVDEAEIFEQKIYLQKCLKLNLESSEPKQNDVKSEG